MNDIMEGTAPRKKRQGLSPSFMQQDEKKSGAQTVAEGAKRLKTFGEATKDKGDKKTGVERLQEYAFGEMEKEKKKKAEEEKKKKEAKAGGVAPEKGFIQRMMDKYWYKTEK